MDGDGTDMVKSDGRCAHSTTNHLTFNTNIPESHSKCHRCGQPCKNKGGHLREYGRSVMCSGEVSYDKCIENVGQIYSSTQQDNDRDGHAHNYGAYNDGCFHPQGNSLPHLQSKTADVYNG